MRILFVCQESKNNYFIQQFLLFPVSLRHVFTWRMCVMLWMQKLAFCVYFFNQKNAQASIMVFLWMHTKSILVAS